MGERLKHLCLVFYLVCNLLITSEMRSKKFNLFEIFDRFRLIGRCCT